MSTKCLSTNFTFNAFSPKLWKINPKTSAISHKILFLATSVRRIDVIMTIFFVDNTLISIKDAPAYAAFFQVGWVVGIFFLGYFFKKM